MARTIAYTVRLDYDLADWIEEEAKKNKLHIAEVFRRAVMFYKTEKKTPPQWI